MGVEFYNGYVAHFQIYGIMFLETDYLILASCDETSLQDVVNLKKKKVSKNQVNYNKEVEK